MSENLNRGARDFSKYDTMATADLEEILRLDAELPEGAESDTEQLFYVMGVLADRRKNSKTTGKTAFEAWESFEKNYMPEEASVSEIAGKKAGFCPAPWLRRAVAAAAVLALLVCIPVTAKAFGLGDLWNVLARWAKETFSFVQEGDENFSEPTPNSLEEFSSLQDALIKSNRDPSIVPTWIPEELILDTIIKDINPDREIYTAHYSYESKTLRIFVKSHLFTDPEKVEVDDDLVEIYPSEGVDYYIFANTDFLQALWITDSYECCIAGNISLKEIKLMIDSIGKD